VLSDAMDAPSMYVAMTRGSQSNTVHIVAADLAQARAKRVDAAGRNRADLGLDHAITAARAEAGDYAPVRQETFGQRMARRMAAIDEQLTAARQAPATQPAVPARSRRLNRRRATPRGTADRGSDGTNRSGPVRTSERQLTVTPARWGVRRRCHPANGDRWDARSCRAMPAVGDGSVQSRRRDLAWC